MAIREMIVSGFLTASDAGNEVDPFLQHLLGQFVDELKEPDKMLLEYTSAAMMGDLWLAYWDDEKLELSMLSEHERGVCLKVPFAPKGGPKVLLPALYQLARIMENG